MNFFLVCRISLTASVNKWLCLPIPVSLSAHHSIFSTGSGLSLISVFSTLPFRM